MTDAADRCRNVYRTLVGRRSGIIREVSLIEAEDGDAPLHYAAANYAVGQPECRSLMAAVAGGAGTNREDAVMAAMCEALERHLASAYESGSAEIKARSEMDSCAISPTSLVAFDNDQQSLPGFPYTRATDATPLRWIVGSRLSDGAHLAVPAFAVYLPYLAEPGEPDVAPGLSTGLACGASMAGATLRAVCEVIERDAVATTWLGGIGVPSVPQAWVDEHASQLLPPLDESTVYDLTGDIGIPVLLVVCRGRGPRGPLLSVGSACHPDPVQALRKAALEAAQDRIYVRQLLEEDPHWRADPDFANVSDFARHAVLYSAHPELVANGFAFFSENQHQPRIPVCRKWPSLLAGEQLQLVIERLQQAGHEAICVDLTPAWVRDQRLFVVRVIVPSLLPLHGHHLLAQRHHPRLTARFKSGQRLWPYPHPFP